MSREHTPIDWDAPINEAEDRYEKMIWESVGKQSAALGDAIITEHGLDDTVDLLLDELSKEKERRNPASWQCVDQEEVYKLTGNYPVFEWGLPDDDEGE